MEILRTPDDCFLGLPDWPFEPVYTVVPVESSGEQTLRVHHVDVSPETWSNETVLCMHGEPSWSFLYRSMIPVLTGAGHRVVAPDLVGFGRSDKPAALTDYTYERHVTWMSHWLVANDLTNLTLVCQDWGGLIGLRLATAFPDRFSRIVIANTGLPQATRRRTRHSSHGATSARRRRCSRRRPSSRADVRPSHWRLRFSPLTTLPIRRNRSRQVLASFRHSCRLLSTILRRRPTLQRGKCSNPGRSRSAVHSATRTR